MDLRDNGTGAAGGLPAGVGMEGAALKNPITLIGCNRRITTETDSKNLRPAD